MTTEQIQSLRTYIRENVDEHDLRYQLALTKIEHYRCSLDFADRELCAEIYETALEWGADNNVSIVRIESFLEDEYL